MDIKKLIYFITIVEEGNITRASKKLHISQPPLSNQLKLLEEELGVKLIERGSRKIRLTDVGEILYKRSKNIVTMYESTLNEIEDFKNGVEGVLKIGTVSTSNQFISDNIIAAYSEKYPKIKFEIYEGNTYEVLDMVEKGIVEIGIVRTPFNSENCNYLNLRREPMVAVINKNKVVNNKSESNKITLAEIERQPIIIYRRYEKLITEVFEKNKIKPNIYCLNDDARTTISWAQAGLGIGIVPQSVINFANNEIKVYEIDEKDLKTDILAIWAKDRYLSISGRNLLEILKI